MLEPSMTARLGYRSTSPPNHTPEAVVNTR